jgi:hypothetical protein
MSEMFLPPYVPKTTTYVPKIFGNRVLLLVIHLSGKKRKVSLFGGFVPISRIRRVLLWKISPLFLANLVWLACFMRIIHKFRIYIKSYCNSIKSEYSIITKIIQLI